MKLTEVRGITGLNYPYRTHVPTYFFHPVLHAAMKPVTRSSKLGTSHQHNAFCANTRKETHTAPCSLDKPRVLSNEI